MQVSILVLLSSCYQQETIAKSVLDDFQDDFVMDLGPEISGLVTDS